MTGKKYYWLKLKEDFFRQKEIKKLRKIAGGDTYTIIYLKIQLLSLKNEGVIFFEGTEETFEEQLALEIDEDLDNIKITMMFLFNNKLMEKIEENEFLINKASECIGKEGSSTERVRKYREKKQLEKQVALQCNIKVTKCNTETETETETKLDLEQQLEKLDSILRNYFEPTDIENIKKYCTENNVVVDVVLEKLEILKTMKTIRNKVGALLTALKEDWKPAKETSNNTLKFNNFEGREYDYDSLEKKLLGWDNED